MGENNANYYQVVEMTHEQKVKMLMKQPKKKLVEMLIECNNILAKRPVEVSFRNEHC